MALSRDTAVLMVKRILHRVLFRLPKGFGRRLIFANKYRRLLSFSNPVSFNEKVQWRIRFDRREILGIASSKVASKKYVLSKDSRVLVPRTLWHGDNLDDIVGLPIDGAWVLKASHRAGCIIFGDGEPDVDTLKRQTMGWLSDAEWRRGRLWGYSQARKEFILERRLPKSVGGISPDDYKFFVFDGCVKLVQVDHGRHVSPTRVLYDRDWKARSEVYTVPRGVPCPPHPAVGSLAVSIAESVGRGLDFVRVDLYLIGDQVYFGELTMYPAGGFSNWPRHLDMEVGACWRLPVMSDPSDVRR